MLWRNEHFLCKCCVEEYQESWAAHENILFSSCKKCLSSQKRQTIADISGHGVEWNRALALSSNRHKFGWAKYSIDGVSVCGEASSIAAREMTTAVRTNDFMRRAVLLRRCVCGRTRGPCCGGRRGLGQRTDPIPQNFPSKSCFTAPPPPTPKTPIKKWWLAVTFG